MVGRQIPVFLAGRNHGLVADTAESRQPTFRTALRVHPANVSPRRTMLFLVFRILGCSEGLRPFHPKPKNLPTPHLSTTECDDRAIHTKPPASGDSPSDRWHTHARRGHRCSTKETLPDEACSTPALSRKQAVPPIQSPTRAPTPHSLSRLLTWLCTCDRHRGDTMPSTIARSMARPSTAEPAAECAIDSSQLLMWNNPHRRIESNSDCPYFGDWLTPYRTSITTGRVCSWTGQFADREAGTDWTSSSLLRFILLGIVRILNLSAVSLLDA